MQPFPFNRAGDVAAALARIGCGMGRSRVVSAERAFGLAIAATDGDLERIRLHLDGDRQAPSGWLLHAIDTPGRLFRIGSMLLGCGTHDRVRIAADAFCEHIDFADSATASQRGFARLAQLAEGRPILVCGAPVHSRLHGALEGCGLAAAQRGLPSLRYSIEPANDFAAYARCLTRNARRAVRRSLRRIDDTTSSGWRLRTFTNPADVDRFTLAVAAIDGDSCQDSVQIAARSGDVARRRRDVLAELGWWRGDLLCNGDEAIAFVDGCECGEFYRPIAIGYHEAWAKLSVGTACLVAVLRDLMNRARVTRIDLAHGDWDYKRRLSNRTVLETDHYLYAPTWRGRLFYPSIAASRRLMPSWTAHRVT